MIRIATAEDKEVILKLAKSFVDALSYEKIVDFEKVSKIVDHFLDAPKSEKIILLYEDVGMIAGAVTPMIFSDVKIATELMWWVDPSERAKEIGSSLLEAFELWAKKVDAFSVSMVCLDERVGKFYEKNGYSLMERMYFKEI